MTLFKCKMCGGTLEIQNGTTVAECDSCGTRQTLPKLDDERRSNLFDRASHFRRNNDFDKAAKIFEQILNEDSSDAETYWSLVLCRYGIEYVEDTADHKRVPTVHRSQLISIFEDPDYKMALQYADHNQREVYAQEAKTINDIQKGILEISKKEKPFDVFICYKESDSSGSRTQDSVIANDLYHQLTLEGFKVFFSRITLEEKIGTAYEPYIFAALNSAKVMIVLGTKQEYFNAVWVRNEWSRYLALIKKGAKKILIPAYKGLDPYDLPEEFSHLQAQDMSKLGFMQDLIRGIRKLTESETRSSKQEVIQGSSALNANAVSLTKRGYLFLEDENWTQADEYFDRALDIDPEYPEAYIGKLLADHEVINTKELLHCGSNIKDNINFQKAVRFADEQTKITLIELGGSVDKTTVMNRINAITNQINGIFGLLDNGVELRISKKYLDACDQLWSLFFELNDLENETIEKRKEHFSNLQRIEEDATSSNKYYGDDFYNNLANEFERFEGEEQTQKLTKKLANYVESNRIRLENEKRVKKQVGILVRRYTKISDSINEYDKEPILQAEKYLENNESVWSIITELDELNYDTEDIMNQQYGNLVNLKQSLIGQIAILEKKDFTESILRLFANMKVLASEFLKFSDFEDGPSHATELLNTVEAQYEQRYLDLVNQLNIASKSKKSNSNDFITLKKQFNDLSEFKDSAEYANLCATQYDIKLKKEKKTSRLISRAALLLVTAFLLTTAFYLKRDKELADQKMAEKAAELESVRSNLNFNPIQFASERLVAFDGDRIIKYEGSYDGPMTIIKFLGPGVYLSNQGEIILEEGYYAENYSEARNWKDIIDGNYDQFGPYFGVTKGGKVQAVDNDNDTSGELDVGSWDNISQVANMFECTAGLKSSGTVVMTGDCDRYESAMEWSDIKTIVSSTSNLIGLKTDGTVVGVGWNYYGQLNVGHWKDVVQIASTSYNTIGLKKDGSVLFAGRNTDHDDRLYTFSDWVDIVYITSSDSTVAGINKNGTVFVQDVFDTTRSRELDWNLLESN